MNTIFRKEYKHYFGTYLGWAVAALLLLCSGFVTVLYGFVYGDRDIGYALRAMQLPLVLLLPLIPSTLWSREKREGTDRLLFSLPFRTHQLVLGKYAAATVVFVLPTLLFLVMPVVYSLFGEISFLSAYSALLGYLLTGCATLAIGCFCATFSRRAWVSYLSSALVCLLLYFLPVVTVISDWIPWLALFLVAVPLVLVGWVLFSATRRPLLAIAFDLVSVGACLVWYLLNPFHFARTVGRVLIATNPYEAMNGFLGGFFSLSSLVALLAAILGFLLLTGLRLSLLRRGRSGHAWSFQIAPVYRKTGLLAAILTLVLLVGVSAPLLMERLPMSIVSPDVSGEETFVPDPTLLDQAAALKEPITVTLLVSGGENAADRNLLSFLRSVAEQSDRITVEVRDPDTIKHHPLAANARNMSILVESEARSRVIDNAELYFYYDSYGGMKIPAESYATYVNQLFSSTEADATTVQSYISTYLSARFDGSARLSSALTYVTATDVPELVVLGGEGTAGMDSDLVARLYDAQYNLSTVETLTALPATCDLLYIHVPTRDFDESELSALSDYLSGGGKLVLSTHYAYLPDLPNLQAFLASWGMSVPDGSTYLCEGDADYTLSTSLPYAILPHISSESRLTGDFSDSAMAILPHPILSTATEGVVHTSWLYTSSKGYYLIDQKDEVAGPAAPEEADAQAGEEKGTGSDTESGDGASSDRSEAAQYAFGVLAERGEGSVLWIGAGDFLTTMADYYSGGGNFTLAQNALDALTAHTSTALTCDSTVINTSILSIPDGAFFLWIVLLALLPIATLTVGVVAVKKRRK